MSFMSAFKVKEACNRELDPIISELGIAAGIYNDGLLSVLDRESSDAALTGWRWLLGQDAIALAVTSVGDLFFWSGSQKAVYFLEVQRGSSTFVDKEIRYLFDEFLVKTEVQKSVLHCELCLALNLRLGALSYGECYIAEPWLMSGGTGHESTYQRGQLDVYLSLAGHAVHQVMNKARGG